MEGCISTEKEVEKFLAKFDSYSKETAHTFNQLYNQLTKLQEEIAQSKLNDVISKTTQSMVVQNSKKVKSGGQKISSQHKDLHSSVSKIGKTIDRNFDADCGSVNITEILSETEHHKLLNTAICEHFYRQGSLSVAESIAKEAAIEIDEKWRKPFIIMNEILKSLKNRDIGPALEWATQNKEKLSQDRSHLEFMLHRIKFIDLLSKGQSHQLEALNYSKNFQQFANEHCKDIQELMGCFIYLKQDLHSSPYSKFLNQSLWEEVYDTFARDACRLMGMSIDSPLMSSFMAGCQALPALVAIKSIIEQRQYSGVLTNNDELPVDIDLQSTQHYHSVFACPILKQQTTSKNPPLRLICGHVISREALNKIGSGSKVKCPLCPIEQSPNEAKEVYF